jgi:hypothetical protein
VINLMLAITAVLSTPIAACVLAALYDARRGVDDLQAR